MLSVPLALGLPNWWPNLSKAGASLVKYLLCLWYLKYIVIVIVISGIHAVHWGRKFPSHQAEFSLLSILVLLKQLLDENS